MKSGDIFSFILSMYDERVPYSFLEKELFVNKFSEYNFWNKKFKLLPDISSKSDLKLDCIKIFSDEFLDKKFFNDILIEYKPFRKGPFSIFDIFIDAEWKSYIKWNRLKDKISTLHKKTVLDIGGGNGYYAFRMIGSGAEKVFYLEPYALFVSQFCIFQKYIKSKQISVLPMAFEDVSFNDEMFDTIFSMGILYHRKSPIEHLDRIFPLLKKGGELILETIVSIDKDILFPEKTYAKMNNVWFIPSVDMILSWLTRIGYRDIKCIDISKTTDIEQRKTEWMNFESLDDFLTSDFKKTVEGYTAPIRAIFIAKR